MKILSSRYEGFEKKYEGRGDERQAVIIVGITGLLSSDIERQLEADHGEGVTSAKVKKQDEAARLSFHAPSEDGKGKALHSVTGRAHSFSLNYEEYKLSFKFTIENGLEEFLMWDLEQPMGWGGHCVLKPRGQRKLFADPNEPGDEDGKPPISPDIEEAESIN